MNKEINDYVFHTHGDNSIEWLKCIKVEVGEKECIATTELFPNSKY